MSDVDVAIGLIRSNRLSNDQILGYHLSGLLRPVTGEGVRVRFVGGLLPYGDEEVGEFHPEIAHALVLRGVAVYV
jgi:hypothetical protein